MPDREVNSGVNSHSELPAPAIEPLQRAAAYRIREAEIDASYVEHVDHCNGVRTARARVEIVRRRRRAAMNTFRAERRPRSPIQRVDSDLSEGDNIADICDISEGGDMSKGSDTSDGGDMSDDTGKDKGYLETKYLYACMRWHIVSRIKQWNFVV